MKHLELKRKARKGWNNDCMIPNKNGSIERYLDKLNLFHLESAAKQTMRGFDYEPYPLDENA